MLINAKSSPRSDLSSSSICLPYFFRLCIFGLLALLPILVPPTDALDPCSSLDTHQSCFCSARKVSCVKVRLRAIPHTFPSDTASLTINDNIYPFVTLGRYNISYLENLQRLSLKGCGIQQIEIGTFSNLKILTFLDLSDNNIRVLNAYTFQGLNLKFLTLKQNRGIRLTPQSFIGMKVISLTLEECEIEEVNYETFLPLNGSLTSLWLNNNKLRTLDPLFERICGHLRIFKISANPLRCGCQLQWLVGYLKRQYEKEKNAVSLTLSVPPKCATPLNLQGREIRTISPHELICDPPQLRDAEITLEQVRRGRLRCKAVGYPTPSISWYRIYPHRQFLQTFPPINRHFPSSARQVNQGDVVIVGSSNYEEYTCSAKNDGGITNLTIRLRWAEVSMGQTNKGISGVSGSGSGADKKITNLGGLEPQRPINKIPVDPDRGRRERERDRGRGVGNMPSSNVNTPPFNTPDDVTEQNYFFRKQFTLLELIGAVVGTFTGTLALFVLIYRFISCSKKKEKKRTFSQYMYESAYSGSHEYDVPRIDHPGPPYGPPPKPPGADGGMEFLDYKTHRKLYNHV